MEGGILQALPPRCRCSVTCCQMTDCQVLLTLFSSPSVSHSRRQPAKSLHALNSARFEWCLGPGCLPLPLCCAGAELQHTPAGSISGPLLFSVLRPAWLMSQCAASELEATPHAFFLLCVPPSGVHTAVCSGGSEAYKDCSYQQLEV